MIDVEKVFQDIRTEGTNQGVITTFVRLGEGRSYNSGEDLLTEMYPKIKTQWVCFSGFDVLRIGMGTLVQGLKELKFNVEIICAGSSRDPGWFNTVDLWEVDYNPVSTFAYSRLRAKDSLRFKVPDVLDPDLLLKISESIGICAAMRMVSVHPEMQLNDSRILDNFRKVERLRICRRQE